MERSISAFAWLRTLCLAAGCGCAALPASAQVPSAAQTPANGAPRQTGTVKEVHTQDFVLTTAAGDVTVKVPESSKVLIVPPGSKSLSSATPGGIKDIQAGDRALVTGTAGDTATALSATRVILMKSEAVAAVHAADEAAWAQGAGGIVKSVGGNAVTLSSGMKTVVVQATPSTIVRRYAPGSVNFADATGSTVAAIQPGDQLRVRGAKSEDGTSITADEIVTGSFKNYSGTIATIDGTAGTITLKDLTTKKTVTVAVTSSSDVRRLPPQMAAMVAGHMRGGAGATAGSEEGSAARGGQADAQPRAGSAGRPARGAGGPPAGDQPGAEGAPGGGTRAYGAGRAAGADLSRMLARLPTETLGGLKQGDAVMIVATAPGSDAQKATAITLLAGVEPILAAPAGQSTQLSPWSMGGESEMGGGMGGGGGAQ